MTSDVKMTMSDLRDGIIESFSLGELDSLCFDLGVRYESLSGDTIDKKAKELIAYCQRRQRLRDLVLRLQQLRPARTWGLPIDSPLLDVINRDEATLTGCRDMAAQIITRVLAIGDRMNKQTLPITSAPVFQLDDLLPFDPGLKTTLAIYQDGGCSQWREVAAPLLDAHTTAVRTTLTRLLAQRRQQGMHVSLTLRRQISQAYLQIGILDFLATHLL